MYLCVCRGLIGGHYMNPIGIIGVLEARKAGTSIQSVIANKVHTCVACMQAVFCEYDVFSKVYYHVLAWVALDVCVVGKAIAVSPILPPYKLWRCPARVYSIVYPDIPSEEIARHSNPVWVWIRASRAHPYCFPSVPMVLVAAYPSFWHTEAFRVKAGAWRAGQWFSREFYYR